MELAFSKTRRRSVAPPADDFRRHLQHELVKRCRANPQYSLRAFAKFLDIDHSSLSQYLRGRRNLSRPIQHRLAERLGLTPEEVALLSAERLPGTDETSSVSADAFAVISDWYHYAIFELVTLRDFRPLPKWIARTLGISVNEVNFALERLFRLGLLKKDARGRWIQGTSFITNTVTPFSTLGLRRLQAQVLQQALRALEEIPMERRDQSSVTIAIPARRVPEAKERIRQFRRSLCASLQEDGDRDVVYHLAVSFYPVTPVISQGENHEPN